MMRLLRITVRVKDQDEALQFYTEKLGFEKRDERPMGPDRRWITISPKDEPSVEIVLQPSDWFQEDLRIQHEALLGKDPTLVFQVDDCQATYDTFLTRGVKFSQPPTNRGYGVEAVASDLYGNTLVFLQLLGVH